MWAAGTACVTATMAGPDLNLACALAAARALGASGWAAAELLMAVRVGLISALAQRSSTADAGGLVHGG